MPVTETDSFAKLKGSMRHGKDKEETQPLNDPEGGDAAPSEPQQQPTQQKGRTRGCATYNM
eukprot:1656537-Amphidinium_carterae.1